ncbi:hypothetical protein ACFPL7_03295 [Dongia soli]|uniref:Uncharacterized protein n=1 Tax=Dongia soli TaxID=600628 RepID=A0ABU5EEA3_9PROT|nr:hypothetical protein [Dongia soli]MDY0884684.1 hypothetical protein [Dongia soli]
MSDDQELIAGFTNIDYGFNAPDEIQLEKKEDMKRHGLASLHLADALTLTYGRGGGG